MNFRPEIKEINLCETIFSKTVTESVQGDLIVPDVKGDIGKILQTDAVAVINSKEITGGRITVSGTVYATILYSPQEGGIESINTNMEFSHTLKTECEDSVHLKTSCCVKSAEHSLYNSRKLNVKTAISISVCVSRNINPSVLSGYECDCDVETCKTLIQTVPSKIYSSDIIPFRETLDIPSGYPSAESVLKCTAAFTDRDFRLLSNKAVIKGNLYITVLYKGEGGEVAKTEFMQPFTEISDAHGAEEDMKENISISLSPFTASVTANGDGNMRAFFVEGRIFVETEGYKLDTEEVITDMFCTGLPLELKTSLLTSSCKSALISSSANEIIPLGELHAKEIADAVIRPIITETEKHDGTLSVSGKADADILFKDDDGNLFNIKKSLPFTCNGPFDGEKPNITAEILNPSVSISGKDAEIRFLVAVKAESVNGTLVSCVTDAFPKEETVAERPSLVVYYSKKGDTLWSIAKNYSATTANIKSANASIDTITEGQRIIIPR